MAAAVAHCQPRSKASFLPVLPPSFSPLSRPCSRSKPPNTASGSSLRTPFAAPDSFQLIVVFSIGTAIAIFMSQRASRTSSQPTTASWTHSDQYEPLATAPPDTPQQEFDMGGKLEKPQEHRLKTLLERIEHNQAATRAFWLFVGLYASALLCCAIIIPVMRK